jgi:hypothetical protein
LAEASVEAELDPDRLLTAMSQAEGISRTAMLEIAIREAAKKRRITLQTEGKEQ